jgi:hypothetical protein
MPLIPYPALQCRLIASEYSAARKSPSPERNALSEDVDVIDVLGVADPLAYKSYIPKCESQDGLDQTKAWGVTALRKFDLRSRVVQSVG